MKYTDPDGRLSTFKLGSKTENISYSDFKAMRDSFREIEAQKNKKNGIHGFLNFVATLIGIIPNPAQALAGTLATADGIASYLVGLSPNDQKRALEQINEVCNTIADIAIETGEVPDVEITMTTEREVIQETIRGVTPYYNRVHRECKDSRVLTVNINGNLNSIELPPISIDLGYDWIPFGPENFQDWEIK